MFEIREGNLDNKFELAKSQMLGDYRATIRTAGKIDRESKDLYNLRVRKLPVVFLSENNFFLAIMMNFYIISVRIL